MYEKSVDGQEVIDHKTGLIWRQAAEPGLFTFQEARAHAQVVAQRTGLPWRVPTLDELASLLDRGRHEPASAFPDMPSECFWSSSRMSASTDVAWVVHFGYGGYVYSSNKHGAVRLVRGN